MEQHLEILERRVARLEAQNRRWKRAVIFAAAAGAAGLGLGAASRARLVEATEFRLVDAKGTVRAAIAAGRGGASISLNNGAGKTRAALVVGDDGAPRFDLIDKGDSARGSLRLAADGSPELSLSDDAKRHRAAIRIAPDGSPRFELVDAEQKVRAAIELGADGEPKVGLVGCASLKLLDPDGSIRASLGCTSLKEAESGTSANTEASSLVLFDRKGRVVFKAPK